ncbi:MAG: hypothetical protein Q9Q13_11010 [Acidobacteriota bacterium]|nr:hypothetical protein [Acidobacteriota bacterium]
MVGDQFVVDEGRALVDDPAQHGHVVGLRLVGVGEEDIGPVGLEAVRGHFLDAEDDRAGVDRLVDLGPGVLVLGVGEDPDR